jgi:EAL domain-containing protein (putative c-di-GMP-specific phosphodiesterase class I)
VDMVSQKAIGVEALARFTEAPLAPPNVWFEQAERIGRGLELELLAIRSALDAARELPEHLHVAVNASPGTVMSPDLLPALLAAGISARRVIVEITEHASVEDYPPLLRARADLRRHGIRVAVDDAGSGYSSFRHIVALAPDIIKIDRELVAGIDHDDARRAMVASLVLYAVQSGSLVVGEGVETAAELDTLALLGVDAVQGFLLGRPTTCAQDWDSWRDARLITSPGLAQPIRPAPSY